MLTYRIICQQLCKCVFNRCTTARWHCAGALLSLNHLNQQPIALLVISPATNTDGCSTNAAGYVNMYTRYLWDLAPQDESLARSCISFIRRLQKPGRRRRHTAICSLRRYLIADIISSKSHSKCYLHSLLSHFWLHLFRLNMLCKSFAKWERTVTNDIVWKLATLSQLTPCADKHWSRTYNGFWLNKT